MKQEELDQIFNNHPPVPEDEDLLQYAADQADDELRHQVEAAMHNDPFLEDAVDGIAALEQKEKLPAVVAEINHKLIKDLRKKQKRQTKGIENINWILLASGVLLLLIVMVVFFYFFVR